MPPSNATVAAGMGRDEMKRMFRIAREQPVSAALAIGSGGAAILLMHKMKAGRALDRELRDEAPDGSDNRFGSVIIDADDPKLAIFTINKAATGLARRMVKTLKGTGVSRVRFMLEDGTVCESADDEEGAAGPASGPPADSAASGAPNPVASKTDLAALLRRMAPALAADPSRREALLALAGTARDALRDGDGMAAQAAIDALRQALDQPSDGAPPGTAPRSAPPPNPADDEVSQGRQPDVALTLVGYPGAGAQESGGPPAASAKAKTGAPKILWKRFVCYVPPETQTFDDMCRLFEVMAFGRVVGRKWDGGNPDMTKNRGRKIEFFVGDFEVQAKSDPAEAQRRKDDKAALGGLPQAQKTALETETARRYVRAAGELPGKDAHTPGTGMSDVYDRQLDGVLQDRDLLKRLPPEVAALLGGKSGEYDPNNYTQLVRVVDKLKAFSPEDMKLYKSLPLRATDNLDLFESSIDLFLARKADLRKALAEKQAPQTPDAPSDPVADVWKGFDGAKLATMTEAERGMMAQQKADEVAMAQFKQMASHPGDTLTGFAKSATLQNTDETMDAIGKDISEAADGDNNAYQRMGAGAGAGAKLSGWLLAVAGVVYAASWLTGVGELATIAAAAGYMLGTMLTLSVVEHDLRIKAASQEKDPEKYKHDVVAAGQAEFNIAMTVATMVFAAVAHFTAKALFPAQLAKLRLSLKNLREQLRLKGGVAELRPGVLQEMASARSGLMKAAEAAKAHALDTAKTLEALSTEEFVKRVQSKEAGGFLDNTKAPAEQKVDFNDLLKSETGRKGIDVYKAKLVKLLRTEVVAEIDRLSQQYVDGVDGFVKDAQSAQSHDDLAAAANDLEKLLGDEHAKQFMDGEQEKLVQQKMQEGSAEAQKELEQTPAKDAAKRVADRIAASPDPKQFQLGFSTDDLMAVVKKGKGLGLPEGDVEDLVLTASRKAKPVPASELIKQMETDAALKKLGGLAPADLAQQHGADVARHGADTPQARMSDPAHRANLEFDPDQKAPRPNERDTALRVEAERGVKLDRYAPKPGMKGDWVDGNGKVYDGCSPPKAQFFDKQMKAGGNYEKSLLDHVGHPNVDFVVVDVSGLGLSPEQLDVLDAMIAKVAGAKNPKIVRIP